MKKIALVSHCILNTASKVVMYNLEEIEAEEALRNNFLKKALEEKIQLIQLPCPEFTLYGNKRWGHVKEQFDNIFFKSHCRQLLTPVIEQLIEYRKNDTEFTIIGIIGIDGSPSCGVDYTCTGKKSYGCLGGRDEELIQIVHETEFCKGKGIFFEVLEELLHENGLQNIKTCGLLATEPHKCLSLLESDVEN